MNTAAEPCPICHKLRADRQTVTVGGMQENLLQVALVSPNVKLLAPWSHMCYGHDTDWTRRRLVQRMKTG